MRHKFSTRFGITRPQKPIDDRILDSLRVRLWNIFHKMYLPTYSTSYDDNIKEFSSAFFSEHMDRVVKHFPSSHSSLRELLEEWFFRTEWHNVYNFIEFIMEYEKPIERNPAYDVGAKARDFEKAVNRALYDEGSAFSLKNGEVVKRLGELEYSEIEAVLELDLPTGYNTPGMHIKKSYEFFVSRNPDYENCVKEAVSALESILKIMTGFEKSNMAELLTEYEKKNRLHPALKKSLSSLFGFASDHGGVRHGGSATAPVSEETARLVMMICATACNFLAHPPQGT